MSIIFYDHLVDKKDILIIVDDSSAPDNQKAKIKQLIDDVLHQGIIEFILQKLHPHSHSAFLTQVHHAPYDPEIIQYLKEKIDHDIEENIQKETERIIEKIKKDLEI